MSFSEPVLVYMLADKAGDVSPTVLCVGLEDWRYPDCVVVKGDSFLPADSRQATKHTAHDLELPQCTFLLQERQKW